MSSSPPDAATLLAELLTLPTDQCLAYLQATGSVERVLLALGDEAERLAVAEVARALETSDLVMALADANGGPLPRARARRARAQTLAHAGRFTDALSLCNEAAALADEAGLAVEAARARLASLQALASLGRHNEAIAAGEAARAAFLAAGEPALAARADLNLGATHQMRDDPASALAHFDRARPALLDEPVTLAQLDTNRGNALMSLDDFSGAETAFLSALPTFEQAGLSWAAAIVEGNLAALATRQGQLQRALYHFERARRHLERDADPADLARLLAEQADVLAILGLLDEAQAGYAGALPDLDSHGLAWEAAQARAGLGRVLLRLGQPAEAEATLATAASAFDALGHTTARAQLDLIRAELVAARGEPDKARDLVTDALAALHDRPAGSAAARHHLARLALAAGDLTAAATELTAALATAEALDLAPLRADLLHVRGLLHRAQGAAEAAVADLRAAVEQVERVRGTLQAERFRAAFLGNRLAIYEDLVTQVLDRGDAEAPAEAFAVVERAKSRALLDLVRGAFDLAEAAEPEPGEPAAAALLAELTRLRAELNWLYSQLDDGDSALQRRSLIDWQRAVRHREQALDALQSRLAATRGPAALYAPPIDLATAQRLVPPDTALIEYFIADGSLLAFVLRDGHVRVFRGLASTAHLTDQVRRLYFQIGRAVRTGRAHGPRAARLLVDARRELAVLQAILLAPLQSVVAGVERLVIIPHGPLHTVPFHALWNGRRYLIEDHEVLYAPSASLLAHTTATKGRDGPLGRLPPSSPGEALVVGVPDAVAPQIGDEARRVAEVLGTDWLLLGASATAERVALAARQAAVIHLACHGRFSAESPLASGLKLADRWLTVRDIYALRLQAALVTLSGCETGRTAISWGDELVGLVRGFFAAGAPSLVVSLWTVNDESTAELMTGFYNAWQAGAPIAAALRAAQCELLATRPHPVFWAPFILVGHP
ncbi:MAG: CHAT domain-containing protein [Ardenticatenaceae bacterium]|nr:CHAT domain-containing protein [Ardenticatenaceae bacterium]